jgi:hypothetical protein
MARTPSTRQSVEPTEKTSAADAMPAPSSGLVNPALALAPFQIARAAAAGWLECWRLGLAASRDRQDDLWRAWRAQSDAALKAAEGVMAVGLTQLSPGAPPAQEPEAANDAAPHVANRALAPASFWLNGAQALTPFATQLGGPWWSALLDHDRRPQA